MSSGGRRGEAGNAGEYGEEERGERIWCARWIIFICQCRNHCYCRVRYFCGLTVDGGGGKAGKCGVDGPRCKSFLKKKRYTRRDENILRGFVFFFFLTKVFEILGSRLFSRSFVACLFLFLTRVPCFILLLLLLRGCACECVYIYFACAWMSGERRESGR